MELPEWDSDDDLFPSLISDNHVHNSHQVYSNNIHSNNRNGAIHNHSSAGTAPAPLRPAQSPRSQHLSVNAANEASFAKTADGGQPITSELYSCREYFLSLHQSTKLQLDFLTRVFESLQESGTIGLQMIDLLNSQIYRNGGSYADISLDTLPKEAHILHQALCQLEKKNGELVLLYSRTIGSQREFFSAQQKRMRDLSNIAVRKAIQTEKSDSSSRVAALAKELELKYISEINSKSAEINSLSQSNQSLLQRIQELEDLNSALRRQLLDQRSICEESMKQALLEEKKIFEIERDKYIERMVLENQRIRQESSDQIDKIIASHQTQLENQRRHDEEIKAILSADRLRVESDYFKLREQYNEAISQNTIAKEKFSLRLSEEKRKFEDSVRQLQSEHVRERAKLKLEIQNVIQKIKDEESKSRATLEDMISKESHSKMQALALQQEKREERFNREIKAIKSEMEEKHEKDIAAIRFKHEQEIKQLLHQNNRMKQAMSRNEISLSESVDPVSINGKTPTEENNRWGKLSKSILLQENSVHGVPNSLLLDEAFESSQGESKNKRDVSVNSSKIETYMSKLQVYLENEIDDVQLPIDERRLSTESDDSLG